MAYSNEMIPLEKLGGTWYINKSNFKMWLKKNNHNPTFNYSLAEKNGVKGLKDIVAFQKKKKEKEIVGFDTPLNSENTKFEWRGKGLLSLFKSKWEIIYSTNDFIIIHFQKTLVTAEGYDIISRQKNLPQALLELADSKLKELGIKEELTLIRQD